MFVFTNLVYFFSYPRRAGVISWRVATAPQIFTSGPSDSFGPQEGHQVVEELWQLADYGISSRTISHGVSYLGLVVNWGWSDSIPAKMPINLGIELNLASLIKCPPRTESNGCSLFWRNPESHSASSKHLQTSRLSDLPRKVPFSCCQLRSLQLQQHRS